MRFTTVITAAAVASLALTGCTINVESDESATPEPEVTEEPEARAEPGTYGSDAALDALYDECEAGDTLACDDLYWDSPFGSEYEAFAEERMDGDYGLTEEDEAALVGIVYESLMSDLDAQLRSEPDLCFAYEFDPEASVDAFMDGFLGSGTPEENEMVLSYKSEAEIRSDVDREMREACL